VKGYIRKVEGKDIRGEYATRRHGACLMMRRKKILDYLEQNGGYVRLNDDTDPEEIKLRLHMSKKTFKKGSRYAVQRG
jgi:predicted RNA-binding protein (virulence factor B family)